MGSVSGPEIPMLAASMPIGASSPLSCPKRPPEVSSPGSIEPPPYRKRPRSSVSGLKGQSSLDVWSTATGTLTPQEESHCLDRGSGDSDYEESEEEQDSEDEEGEQGERLSNGPLSEYHPTSTTIIKVAGSFFTVAIAGRSVGEDLNLYSTAKWC